MLKQRIITALVLLAFLLPALFYPAIEPFAALLLVLMTAAGWEWARLNGLGSSASWLWALGLGALLIGVWLAGGLNWSLTPLWWLASALWGGLAVVMLSRGVPAWAAWPKTLRLVTGLFLLACAWLAVVQAKLVGLAFLVSVLTLVWMADVAAYAGGKTFGRRKLAPTISPGKSWEGAISGALGVVLLALGWVAYGSNQAQPTSSLFEHLWSFGGVVAAVSLFGLIAMSVLGDLLESLVKRSAGAKDSSQLLPGHGGVLDRIDALLPVLPLAMLLHSF